jgi:hypothetical protein
MSNEKILKTEVSHPEKSPEHEYAPTDTEDLATSLERLAQKLKDFARRLQDKLVGDIDHFDSDFGDEPIRYEDLPELQADLLRRVAETGTDDTGGLETDVQPMAEAEIPLTEELPEGVPAEITFSGTGDERIDRKTAKGLNVKRPLRGEPALAHIEVPHLKGGDDVDYFAFDLIDKLQRGDITLTQYKKAKALAAQQTENVSTFYQIFAEKESRNPFIMRLLYEQHPEGKEPTYDEMTADKMDELEARGAELEKRAKQLQAEKPADEAATPLEIPENVTPQEYVDLSARYNALMAKLIKQRDQINRRKLSNLPIGKVLNSAWERGDQLENRQAYAQILKVVEEIERELGD